MLPNNLIFMFATNQMPDKPTHKRTEDAGDDCDEDDNQNLDEYHENEEVNEYIFENRGSQRDERTNMELYFRKLEKIKSLNNFHNFLRFQLHSINSTFEIKSLVDSNVIFSLQILCKKRFFLLQF